MRKAVILPNYIVPGEQNSEIRREHNSDITETAEDLPYQTPTQTSHSPEARVGRNGRSYISQDELRRFFEQCLNREREEANSDWNIGNNELYPDLQPEFIDMEGTAASQNTEETGRLNSSLSQQSLSH